MLAFYMGLNQTMAASEEKNAEDPGYSMPDQVGHGEVCFFLASFLCSAGTVFFLRWLPIYAIFSKLFGPTFNSHITATAVASSETPMLVRGQVDIGIPTS